MDSLQNTLGNTRKNYDSDSLNEENLEKDPFEQFKKWLNLAISANQPEVNAMTVSTVDAKGRPSSRIVLLKGFDHDGFVFYTNYESRKGKELLLDPYACINIFWPALERQIRIEGKVIKTSEAVSDEYFNSRPRESQLGAWASAQSSIIKSREDFELKLKNLEKKFDGKPVPRPPQWGGYCVQPYLFEFWQGRSNRLHDRFQFQLENNIWKIDRLSP